LKETTIHILLIGMFSAFLFFYGLGEMALTDPDETFYAQTAREMSDSGQWVTPLIFGKPQFEKPVLYYWLIEISYRIFGVSEFSARVPSAVAGLIGLLGIYLLGRLVFNPLCGLLSALIMGTSAEYIALSRGCVTDMVLTVLLLFCMLFFLYGRRKQARVYYFLSSSMAALAVLTKGPIGLFIPGVVIAVYLFTGKRWKDIKEIPVFWAVAIFLAICLPWYLIAYKIHGDIFLSEFFGFQNVTRFLVPEHTTGDSPFFYIPVILGGIFPWTSFFIFALWRYYKGPSDPDGYSYKFFLTVWLAVVFIFFSASRTKLVTYVFPLFPVLSIITGRFWERCITDYREDRRLRTFLNISYYSFLAIALSGVIAVYFVIKHKYADAVYPVMQSGAVFMAILAVSLIFFLRKRFILCFLSIILTVSISLVPVIELVLPVIEKHESRETLVALIKSMADPEDDIGGEGDHRRGVAFYTGRHDIEDLHPQDKLARFLSREDTVWGVVKYKHYEQLKKDRKDIYVRSIARAGKYVLVTNKPPRAIDSR